MGDAARHMSCPVCASYEVSRLYVASVDVDACECLTCGAEWDESRTSGVPQAPGQATSVMLRRRQRR